MKVGNKGAGDGVLIAVIALLAIVALAFLYGSPRYTGSTLPNQPTTTPSPTANLCPSGLQNLQVVTATQVPVSKAILYLNQPIAIATAGGYSKGIVLVTDTDTQGSAVAYKTTTVGCTNDAFNFGVNVYGTASSSFNSANPVFVSFLAGTTAPPVILTSTNGSVPNARWETLPSYGNATAAGDSSTAVMTTSQGISKGTQFNLALQLNGVGTALSGTQAWGGPVAGNGIQVGIDYKGSSAWKPGDIVISVNQAPSGWTLTPATCNANFAQAKGVTVCWSAPQITGGVVILSVSGAPSGGSPASSSDDPTIFVKDMQYYTYAASNGALGIGYDGYDLGNNAQGQTALNATIVH